MEAMTNSDSSHDSDTVNRWYATATVRNTKRILVPERSRGEFIFPRSRQLMSSHPAITAMGDDAIAYVLAQSAYQYMYEIGLLETRFVIDCALNIVNGRMGDVGDDKKREALTIVIDEGYHAYVALDFIIQMKAKTGIVPVDVPSTNGNLSAVRRALHKLPASIHDDFQLISVCLAEHTLTRDLLSIGKEKDATATFTQVMTDHVADEGRHANYFAKLMKAHWSLLPESTKTLIGTMLPAYLDDYLAGDLERVFDRKVLASMDIAPRQADAVIRDTQAEFERNTNDYIRKTKDNLVKLLQRTGITAHEATQAAFRRHTAEPAGERAASYV